MSRWVGEAVLLRSVDFGESDRIVHLLTPDRGKLTAIAKGARRSVKRFSGTLDLFQHLRVQAWQGRQAHMARLEQAALLDPFLGLRRRALRFGLACYLIELLDRMAPEGGSGPDTRALFEFALSSLRALEDSEPDRRLRLWVELRALSALGLRPELRRCVRCGKEPSGSAPLGFHVAEGGVVCKGCQAPDRGSSGGLVEVHVGTIRALEQGLRFDFQQLGRLAMSPSALAEAQGLVRRFGRFHVGIELRSEVFLDLLGERGRARGVA